MKLDGKRVLITGGGSGVGLEGLRRDPAEIRVAQVRRLVPLARLMPTLGDRLVARGRR